MRIRDYIGAVSRAGAEKGMSEKMRRLMSGAAALARKNPEELLSRISGIARLEAVAEGEFRRWAEPEQIGVEDCPDRFDVCDLRIWIRIADLAGVEAIPAVTVASLEEDELEALLGTVDIPAPVRRSVMGGMMRLASSDPEAPRPEATDADADVIRFLSGFDRSRDRNKAGHRAWSKIDGALDELPASWMVRTHVSGSSNLKALVGTGLMKSADDTARVRPDFELGGGWVRAGNRRIIDFSDPRFLELAIGGHKPGAHYLARPWEPAGRFHRGEDLHRANSPLAGPGEWPAEWRVFVKSGEVTGVANYYGWTGEGPSPENAWNAIRSAALAQRMADQVSAMGLAGSFMDQVFIRSGGNPDVVALLDQEWPDDRIHATLDFYEGEGGLKFLEAGPAHMPGGGGHPCAFAGQGCADGNVIARCEGIAYRNMPHVHLGEPSTWIDGDPEGAIEDWSTAAVRAAEFADPDEDMVAFLERRGVDMCPAPSL